MKKDGKRKNLAKAPSNKDLTLTLIFRRGNRALRNTNKISSISARVALRHTNAIAVSERTSKKSLSKIGDGTENSADRMGKTLCKTITKKYNNSTNTISRDLSGRYKERKQLSYRSHVAQGRSGSRWTENSDSFSHRTPALEID